MSNETHAERRQRRQDFIKAHARQIGDFVDKGRGGVHWRQIAGLKHFVSVTVRTELNYSKKTVWNDIWYLMRRDYEKMQVDATLPPPAPKPRDRFLEKLDGKISDLSGISRTEYGEGRYDALMDIRKEYKELKINQQ